MNRSSWTQTIIQLALWINKQCISTQSFSKNQNQCLKKSELLFITFNVSTLEGPDDVVG